MIISLIKYNISYYVKTAKYLPPLIFYMAFLGINYQTAPIGVWSNLHTTTIAIFIFASWIGSSFINSEDKTQQYITRLHVKNETIYYLAKIASIIVFMIPFYAITMLIPLVQGSFIRNVLFIEMMVYIVMYFLIGLLGVALGVLFNRDLISTEPAILAQILIVTIIILPFNVMFEEHLMIVTAYHLLPPVNFLAERLHSLGDGHFVFDSHFFIFVMYALGYAMALIAFFNWAVQRRNKK